MFCLQQELEAVAWETGSRVMPRGAGALNIYHCKATETLQAVSAAFPLGGEAA